MESTTPKTKACRINDLTTSSMAATVYISCLEPKSTTELVNFIYKPVSVADINSNPVSKARASLERAGYLVRCDVQLRNTRFRATHRPIMDYVHAVIDRDSSLKFDDQVYAALEKVIDSQWFRGFFSEKFLRTPPRYVVYNNVHIESKENDNTNTDKKGKLVISDAMRLATGILADIGAFGIALKQLDASSKPFHMLDVQTMVAEPQFNDLIHQYQNARTVEIAQKLFDEIGSYRTDKRGLPSDTGTTLVPEELMKQISWMPGILPADLCNLMIRSTDRPPLSLWTSLDKVIIPNILSKKNKPN